MEEYTMESVVRGHHVYKVDSTRTCCRASAISIASLNFVTSRTDVRITYGYLVHVLNKYGVKPS